MSQISQIKKIYHAAIYVRLSKEDGAVASHEKTESNSIANQKSLIRDFSKTKMILRLCRSMLMMVSAALILSDRHSR